MSDPGGETEIVSAPVAVRLDRIETVVGKGSLRALVDVTLTVGDCVEIEIRGCGILRTAQGLQARSPQHRSSDGSWRMSVGLPRAVWNDVLDVFVEQVEEKSDPRNSPTPHAGLA